MRKCPDCGGRSHIAETREHRDTIYRVRRCIVCKARWQTWEASVDVSSAIASIERLLASMKVKTVGGQHARVGKSALQTAQAGNGGGWKADHVADGDVPQSRAARRAP